MKTCTKCLETKEPEEFYKDQTRLDGRFPWCKTCSKANDTGEKRKSQKRAREKGPEYREYINTYRQKPESKEQVRQYNEDYRVTKHGADTNKKSVERHPERFAARQAIKKTISRGEMEPASAKQCSYYNPDVCTEWIQYHHHNGYDQEHWLDVVPVCTYHHGVIARKYDTTLQNLVPG